MEKIQHKREAGGYSEGLVGLRKELGFYSEYNGNSQVAVIKNPPAMQKCRFSPWVRKIPGEGNGDSPQYSCLGNPMDRGAWRATVHRVAKESDMTEQLSMHMRGSHRKA